MRSMSASIRGRRAPVFVVIAAIAAAILATLLWRPWAAPEAVVAAGPGAVAAAPAPALLDLPDEATVLIFGDSWTYGSAATVPTLGYAYLAGEVAGWNTVVDGVRGSGYLKPGWDGPDFLTRILALDPALDPNLIIVQGSINDRREPAAGYRAAVDAAWDALAAQFPRAQIVILGPAPQVLPVQKATARIDGDLAAAAAERGWWYLSPIAEDWITVENYLGVIDTGAGRDHPSTAGHRYLAERLIEAVSAITR